MGRMTKAQKADAAEAIEHLRELLPPGSTVYTVLRHVSRSGMMRAIDCYVIRDGDGKPYPQWLSGYMATAWGEKLHKTWNTLIAGGCGMDMGYHLVMNLSYTLHGMESVGKKARAAGEKGMPVDPSPGNYRAGYSLNHRWM